MHTCVYIYIYIYIYIDMILYNQGWLAVLPDCSVAKDRVNHKQDDNKQIHATTYYYCYYYYYYYHYHYYY